MRHKLLSTVRSESREFSFVEATFMYLIKQTVQLKNNTMSRRNVYFCKSNLMLVIFLLDLIHI